MKEKLIQPNVNLRQQKIVNLLNKKRAPEFSNLSTEPNKNKFIVIKNATISTNYHQQKNRNNINNEQNINKNKRKIFSTNKNPNFDFKYFIDEIELYTKNDKNDFNINNNIINNEKEKNNTYKINKINNINNINNINITNNQEKEQTFNQIEIKKIPQIIDFEKKTNIINENNNKIDIKNNYLNNNINYINFINDNSNTKNNIIFFGSSQNIDKLPENSTKNNTNNNTSTPLTGHPSTSFTNLNPPNFTVTIENNNNNLLSESKQFGNYTFYKDKIIGTGSFGEVLYGINKSENLEVAVKIVSSDTTEKSINKEIYFTKMLQNDKGFPHFYDSGTYESKKIMIESLLGPSLDKLFKYCNKYFPIKTVCKIGKEVISRLQTMHKKGLIHRDLKPNNLTWGNFSNKYEKISNINEKNDINTIYLIDFGLSCSFLERHQCHYKYEEGLNFVGTLRYSSINSHKGIRQSRRDDLESMMYILIYFYKGKLPWQDIKVKQKHERQEKILKKKQMTSIRELCDGLPYQFNVLLDYSKKLGFVENPKYEKYDYLFQNIIDNIKESENIEKNYFYIWEKSLVDDLIKVNGDENSLNEEIVMIFKGYPIKIKNYIQFLMNERKTNIDKNNIGVKNKDSSNNTSDNIGILRNNNFVISGSLNELASNNIATIFNNNGIENNQFMKNSNLFNFHDFYFSNNYCHSSKTV